MTKTSLAAMVWMLAFVGTAEAGVPNGTIGVGTEYGLAFSSARGTGGGMMGGGSAFGGATGLALASMNYDAGAFHVGGFLGFRDGGDDDDTDYAVGGRFFYHVHGGAMSDFSLGGNLGLVSIDTPGDRISGMFLEPGFRIRLFPASNVALSFTGGIAIGLIDADGFAIGGQASGSAGVHYYFF